MVTRKKEAVPLSWTDWNAALRECTMESEVQALMESEQAGRNRFMFMQRAHGRFNKLRGERERKELAAQSRG